MLLLLVYVLTAANYRTLSVYNNEGMWRPCLNDLLPYQIVLAANDNVDML